MFDAARAVLRRNPDFARLFWASVVSMCGDWFSIVAVSTLLMELTGKAATATYVHAAMVLPIFALAPVAGYLADRFARKRLMIIADLARVPAALGLLAAQHFHSAPLAIACIVALGIGAAFSDPVANAALPNVVAPNDLSMAQAMFAGTWGAMLIVGASLGGIVAGTLGKSAAFVIDAGSFALSAAILATIVAPLEARRRKKRNTDGVAVLPRESGSQRASASVSVPPPPFAMFLKRTPIVMRLLGGKLGVSIANGTVGLLPALLAVRYGIDERGLGGVFAARGFGVMLGPLLGRRLVGSAPSKNAIFWVCSGSTFLYAGAYALVPFAPNVWVVAALVALAHLGGGAQWTMSSYGLATRTPDALRGRVMSLHYGLATLAIGASAIAAGLVAQAVGIDTAMWTLSTAAAGFGLVWGMWAWGVLRSRIDED